MDNTHYTAAIVTSALLVASLVMAPAASAADTVAYFYNQPDSAAPIGVTIKGKTTVTVKPVAPGHISAAIALPRGYLSPLYASAAMQKSLKDMGLPLPTQIDISFHSPGGSTRLGLPLGAAPEPEDIPAVAVRESDYKLAAEGKALIAIVDETHVKGLKLDSGYSGVWFRKPNGDVWFERSSQGSSLVSPDMPKPGHYDLLSNDSGAMTQQKARTARSIGSLTPANLHPGHISVYLIRKPGTLEHVIDLSPK